MRTRIHAAGLVIGALVASVSLTVTAAASPHVEAHRGSTALAPTRLKVAGQAADPLVGTSRPTFSWAPMDSGRAERQSGYELKVSAVPSDRGNRRVPTWDSGRVGSSRSAGVSYRGPALRADTTYEWEVRTWNAEGDRSPWSSAQRFDVGPLTVHDWKASWLQAADGALVRRDFTLSKKVARARLYLGAQGLVEPHLNGARVAPDQVLDSSVTDYAKRVVYRDLDVTSELRRGANTLAVMVGKGQHSGPPTFIAQLSVTYTDGTHAVIATDEHWSTTAGPVTRDDFYYGESWDARKQVAGWDAPGLDTSAWAPAAVVGPVSQPKSLALGGTVTSLDTTTTAGWSPGALVDGIDVSTDQSEGYHSGIETDADHTKWVQADLGSSQALRTITLFPAHPTNDTSGDYPGAGFPVRYRVEVSDDPTFATATTVVDRTDADQPAPGDTPVSLTTDAVGRYVRVTGTKLSCLPGGCSFRLAELGVYGEHPATTWGRTALEADSTPPTRVVSTVKPTKVTVEGKGTVYDFGQNYTGQVTLTAKAPAGSKVTVTKGEILDADGDVTTSNISFSSSDTGRQVDDYTFDGSGEQTWTPAFNYAGFRYAQVSGLPDGTKVTVRADVIHSDVAPAGSFTTSDPLLNQIQTALVQTQLNDLQTLPLDCPTREKRGWTGDAGDSDAEAMANLDMQSLYEKWFGDIRTSINADGSIPAVAPDEGAGSTYLTDPAWGSAYPQVVWDSYQQYGDAAVLRENYDEIKAWVDYLGTISDSDHLVVRAPVSYGDDWVASQSTPHVYFQTLYYLLDSRLLAQMAHVLGRSSDDAAYSGLAHEIQASFTATYFDAATDTYGPKTQLAYAMPLVLGIVPEGHEQAVLSKLVADVVAHQDHVTTGFVGTSFVYQALGLYHRDDVALAIAQRTDYPSFGYMVENGPGTIWEKWPNSSAPDGTSSKDHIGLAGSIGQWYYQHLAGIQPGSAGWRTFTLAPSIAGDLTHVSATQQTVRGTVASSWRLDGSTLVYRAQVPVGSKATIELPLPGGARSTVRESGRRILLDGRLADSDSGLTVHGVSDGALRLTAGSGSYTFTVTAPSTPTTTLALSTATTSTDIQPGATGDVDVALASSSTREGDVVLGADVPEGWTVSSSPSSVPLTVGRSFGLASIRLTPPATASGTYPVTLRARASDGTVATAKITVAVFRTTTLYDFESGTQGWEAGAGVSGPAAVTGFANGPRVPHGGTKSLEATITGPASDWHSVSVTPSSPLDLSRATHLQLWMDSWGGLPGATAYQARVVVHGTADDKELDARIDNDAWNRLDLDLSSWAGRSAITSIDVSFRAVGSDAEWGGRFQLDDIAWTDQASVTAVP